MAIIQVPRTYPRPLAWQDRARNGKVPDWRLVSGATARVLFALTHCRKLVFQKALSPGNIHAGTSGTITPWRWKCRTGEGNVTGSTITLRAEAEILPASDASAADPRWRIFAGGNNSDYRRFPTLVSSPDAGDIRSQTVKLTGLAPNTEYDCGLEIVDYGKVVALSVWEEVSLDANTNADYVTGSYRTIGNGLEITDAQHAEFAADPHQIWKHNASHYFNLVPDLYSSPSWTTTSATYVNLLDASASTTVDGTTPGITVGSDYHAPVHVDTCSAVFAVYAKSATGSGNDSVILADSTGTLGTVSGFNNSGEWKQVAVNLNGASSTHKVDVQFRDTGGETLTVYAVSCYAYEA